MYYILLYFILDLFYYMFHVFYIASEMINLLTQIIIQYQIFLYNISSFYKSIKYDFNFVNFISDV